MYVQLAKHRKVTIVVLFVAALFLFVQRQAGLPLTKTLSLDPGRMDQRDGNGAASVRLPIEAGQSGRLIEDGIGIGIRAKNTKEVITEAGGRFRTRKGALFFSSSDGTDPKSNGRIYVFNTGLVPPAWLIGILIALLALSAAPEIRSGLKRALQAFREEFRRQGDLVLPATPALVVAFATAVGTLVYLAPWSGGGSRSVFLTSWDNYLKSVDTSPQILGLKAGLISLLLGIGIALLVKNKHQPEIRFKPVTAFLIGALLCCSALVGTWLEGGEPRILLSLALIGAGVSGFFFSRGRVANWGRRLICAVGVASMVLAIVWGVSDAKFDGMPGYFSSEFFSWHYCAYYEDAVRLADRASLSEINNHYGLTWQMLAGLLQQVRGWWSAADYVSYTRWVQTGLLMATLAWLAFQARRRPSWWILAFAMFLCFVYHGSATSVMNGTQSLLRRSGLLVFCCSLGLFSHLAEKHPQSARWIAACHGLLIGLAIPFSTEFGCLIAMAGLLFWMLSTEMFSTNWIMRGGFFLLGCFSSLGLFIGCSWLGGEGIEPWVLIRFLRTPIQDGFGGLPLDYSPLALAGWLTASGLFVHGFLSWRKGPVAPDLRIVTVCASLTLPLMMYYLQRNHISSLHTPLLPLGFASVYWFGLRAASPAARPNPGPLSWWAPACVIVLLASTVETWVVIECKVARAHLNSARANLVESTDGAEIISESQLAFVKRLKEERRGFIFVSPVTFQAATALETANRIVGRRGVFDYVSGILTPVAQKEELARLRESGIRIVLIDERYEATSERGGRFWAERKGEIEQGISALGYIRDASSQSGWGVYQIGPQGGKAR